MMTSAPEASPQEADLPEQERRLFAELKELSVKEDKPTKGGSVNGARPKSRKEKK